MVNTVCNMHDYSTRDQHAYKHAAGIGASEGGKARGGHGRRGAARGEGPGVGLPNCFLTAS